MCASPARLPSAAPSRCNSCQAPVGASNDLYRFGIRPIASSSARAGASGVDRSCPQLRNVGATIRSAAGVDGCRSLLQPDLLAEGNTDANAYTCLCPAPDLRVRKCACCRRRSRSIPCGICGRTNLRGGAMRNMSCSWRGHDKPCAQRTTIRPAGTQLSSQQPGRGARGGHDHGPRFNAGVGT